MLARAILGRMPEAADVSDAIDHDIPLSDIESGRVRGLTQRVLRELSSAFESLGASDAPLVVRESNPQFAQIAAPCQAGP